MIYTKSHFSWLLLNMRNFCVSFFLQNWVGVVIEGDMLKGFNIDLRSSGTYFPLICPRDGQKIPTQHSNTRKPANTTTWFCQTKFRIICYFLAFILRDICHIQIYYKLHNFEKAKWILKAFNCCFFCKIGFKKSGNFQNVLKFLT